jgi:hypothetical protein
MLFSGPTQLSFIELGLAAASIAGIKGRTRRLNQTVEAKTVHFGIPGS